MHIPPPYCHTTALLPYRPTITLLPSRPTTTSTTLLPYCGAVHWQMSHPDTRLRDKVGRHMSQPEPLDLKTNAPKLKYSTGRTSPAVRQDLNNFLTSNTPFEPTLISNTFNSIRRTQANHSQQQMPDLRHDYRNETNAIVHQSTRETKAEVLQLAKANKAGANGTPPLLRPCLVLLAKGFVVCFAHHFSRVRSARV